MTGEEMTKIFTGVVKANPDGIPEGTRVLVYAFATGEVEVSFRGVDSPRWGPPVQLVEESSG